MRSQGFVSPKRRMRQAPTRRNRLIQIASRRPCDGMGLTYLADLCICAGYVMLTIDMDINGSSTHWGVAT